MVFSPSEMYRDLVSLVQPTIIFSRLCGVSPSALREPYVPAGYKIYSLLSCLSFIWCHVFIVLDHVEKHREFRILIHRIFDVVVLNVVCSLILFPYLRKEKLVSYFVSMESVQESLHKLNIRQLPEPSKKLQICWAIFFFHVVFVVVFTCTSTTRYWLVLAASVTSTITITGVYAKLHVMLDIVSRKFNLLNWHLDDLNNRWPLFLPRPPDVTFSELASVSSWRRSHFVLYNRHVRDVTPDKIWTFNQAHFQIYSAHRALNNVCSMDLLALTFYQGVFVVFVSYILLTEDTERIMKYCSIYIMIFNSTSFFVLLTYATKIKEKVNTKFNNL